MQSCTAVAKRESKIFILGLHSKNGSSVQYCSMSIRGNQEDTVCEFIDELEAATPTTALGDGLRKRRLTFLLVGTFLADEIEETLSSESDREGRFARSAALAEPGSP